jgi:hypothetical protein
MLSEHIDISRIESLGFDQIGLTLLPLALSAHDIGQRFRNPAAIRQERTRALKVTQRGPVILQTSIVVIALGMERLTEAGFKSTPEPRRL